MRHLFLRFVVLADVVGFGIFGGTKQKLAYALIEPSSCPRVTTPAPKPGSGPEDHAIAIITKRNF